MPVKEKIQLYFNDFSVFDDLNEIVSIKDNFDDLLIPLDHPARSTNDTYYADNDHVLRTQTSAHQNMLLKAGHKDSLLRAMYTAKTLLTKLIIRFSIRWKV